MKYLIYFLIFIFILSLSSAIYAWYHPKVVIEKEYVNVPVEKEVIKIKKIEVPVEKVITFEKPIIIEKLKLPDWVKNDENKQVIANAEISPYKGKTSVVTIFDTKTGNADIIAKQKPVDLFEFENNKEIGIRAGIATSGKIESSLYGSWSFFRIGNFHTSIYMEGNTAPEGKIQLGVGYQF